MSAAPASIAVVIPAHDAEAFIADALDSVWCQTRRPEECVVVDDGSRDRTAGLVEAWSAEHDLPVRLLRQENRGESACRSAAVRAAEADLVALLDADDVLLPEALAILEAGFRTWPDLVACFGNAERRLGDSIGSDYLTGKPLWRLPYEEARVPTATGDELELRRLTSGLFESLLGGSYIANCAAMVRRDAAIEAGLWSDEFRTAGDRDFWLRLSRVGPFAFSSRHVARVRYHAGSLTATTEAARKAEDRVRVLDKMERLAGPLRLDEHELAAVRIARGHVVGHALYWASRDGLGTYRRMVATLDAAGEISRVTHLRHLLRALFAPLTRAMRPGRRHPDRR